MIKWKYMTQQFLTKGLGEQAMVDKRQAEMSAMGEYGWELVSTNVYHNADIDADVIILFYKKPIDSSQTPPPRGR